MARAEDLLDGLLDDAMPDEPDAVWRADELAAQLLHWFGLNVEKEGLDLERGREDIREAVLGLVHAKYADKEQRVGDEMRRYERFVVLQILDSQWKDHLLALDHLKEGISLRAYAQRDPLVEYKRESYELFAEMKERLEQEVVRYLMLLEPMSREERLEAEARQRREQERIFAAASAAKEGVDARKGRTIRRQSRKIGRNDPCFCGSGKKFKKCHGRSG
jgi:preprotein translocase subunit SecA